MALAALLGPFERWLAMTQGPRHRREVEGIYARLSPIDAPLLVQLRLDGVSLLVERLALRGRQAAARAVLEVTTEISTEMTTEM